MFRTLIAVFGLSFLTFAYTPSVQAQSEMRCGPYEELIELLTSLGEQRTGVGIVDGPLTGIVVSELWLNQNEGEGFGEWTYVLVGENGVACLAAYGSDWTIIPVQPVVPGQDT